MLRAPLLLVLDEPSATSTPPPPSPWPRPSRACAGGARCC
ncbi:MAG: hypothetical protein R3F60_24570 [bacterium]